MRALAAALLTVLFLAAACSTNPSDGASSGKPDASGGAAGSGSPEEATRASRGGQEATVEETTGGVPPPEATLGAGPEPPGVLLRLEGDPETTFSGICSVGARRSVLSGQVPKRFAFDPKGRRLSCRIQKRGARGGELKVILTADDTVRSVQQTDSPRSVINVSYSG